MWEELSWAWIYPYFITFRYRSNSAVFCGKLPKPTWRYHILNNREGRIRKKAEWTAASPERNAENAAFQEKYIYEASFPVYDALHISHSSGAS